MTRDTYEKKMNETQALLYQFIKLHPNHTSESIMNYLSDEYHNDVDWRVELSEAMGFLITQDYVKVDPKNGVVYIWGAGAK